MRWLWLATLGFFSFLAVRAGLEGDFTVAVVQVVIGLGVSWWLSPWNGGRSVRQADLLDMEPADRHVVIYWRPGCTYCLRLKRALGRLRAKALWVNIWQDDDAAAFVRSVNDGNETVPTVVVGGAPHTNPDPALVREWLSSTPA